MNHAYLQRILTSRVYDVAVETPLQPAPRLSARLGNSVLFKREDLQPIFSFKLRGAYNRMAHLSPEERSRGVITASAGNHAQGVAFSGQHLGVRSVIVMPVTTPEIKVAACRARGAEVVLHGDSYSDAEAHAYALQGELGLTFIHPYDDPLVIAGQGTVGLELSQQLRAEQFRVFVPIGGGGLAAGMALCAKARRPDLRIVGVQTAVCPSMRAAVRGELPPPLRTLTLADGIAVKRPGAITTPIIARLVDDIVLVDENTIEHAVQTLAAQQKIVAEGAGAVAFAAVAAEPARFAGRAVAAVVSGGNIDRRMLSTVLLRGLARDGKAARLRIEIEDLPGTLSRVTRLIGDSGADIIDITHERTFSRLPPRCAELDVLLETRGRAHVEHIVGLLRAAGFPAHAL